MPQQPRSSGQGRQSNPEILGDLAAARQSEPDRFVLKLFGKPSVGLGQGDPHGLKKYPPLPRYCWRIRCCPSFAVGGLTRSARTQSAGCPLQKLGSGLSSPEADSPAVSSLKQVHPCLASSSERDQCLIGLSVPRILPHQASRPEPSPQAHGSRSSTCFTLSGQIEEIRKASLPETPRFTSARNSGGGAPSRRLAIAPRVCERSRPALVRTSFGGPLPGS